MSPQVGRLVEGWFELHGRKGPAGVSSADGVGAYAVVGVGSRRSPLEVYGKRPLSRFVGRERELTDLHDLLARVAQGRGQIVGIVGEPGVGKSRLCYELTQAQRPHGWLTLESSPTAYGKDTPYLPVIDLLKAYFQLDARDEPQTIRDKVMGKLRLLDEGLMPTLPAVLALLDVPVEDPHWQALEPPQRRQRTLEACTRLLLRASQVQPMLVVVENLHWIDTATQAFLDRLVDSLSHTPVLLLVNYRPDYQHRWVSKTYYTQLRLDPLPPAHAAELLHELLGVAPGPQAPHPGPHCAHGGQSLLPGGKRAHPGGDQGARRRARGLSPDAGSTAYADTDDGTSGAGGAARPPATRREAPAAHRRGYWYGGASATIAGDRRAARGGGARRPQAPPGG